MPRLSRTLWSLSVLASGAGLACAPFNPAGNSPTARVEPPPPSAVTRLAGVVSFQDVPVAGAHVQVFDIATGRVVPVLASEETAWRTNAEGRFDFLIATPPAHRVLKVMALTDAGVWLTLVAGSGASLASGWRLQNQEPLLAFLQLTPGTTAATQMMEGPLQLQFRLPAAQRDAAVARLLRDTRDMLGALELALQDNPSQARQVLENGDAQGRGRDPKLLANTLEFLGLLDGWSQHVIEAVTDFSRQVDVFASLAELERGLSALEPGSFPIGQLSRETDGTFRYTDVRGRLIEGVLIQDPFESGPAVDIAPEDLPAPDSIPDPGAESLASGGLNISDGELVDPIASEEVL
jgi:hypothetical protein